MMIKMFRHFMPRSILLLGLAEVLILMISVYSGMHIYAISKNVEPVDSWLLVFLRSALFAGVMFATIVAMGLYWQANRNSLFNVVLRVILGFMLGTGVLAALFYFLPDLILPRDVVETILGLGLLGVLCIHGLHYALSGIESLKQRVLVLGAGSAAKQLSQSEWPGVNIVGYMPIPGQRILDYRLSLLNDEGSILEVAEKHKIQEIIVALDERRQAMPIDSLLECKLKGFKIVTVADFIERGSGKINLSMLNPSAIIFSEGFRIPLSKSYGKRLFDIGISLLLLILMFPIMLLTSLAILIESGFRGPVFFRQVRLGKGGIPFEVMKFRTMQVDAEKNGSPQYAEQNDPRVTKPGRLLRKLRLDELPQLINVLRGEMSFVGPRPERPEFVSKYTQTIPYYGLRHETKPGITGWAQISYPYGSTDQDTVEKLQYDLYYLKHYNLTLDLNILFQTVHTVLWGRGAR
jgi:sugar transferase (PEP-CTERM system associated)